MPAATPGSAQPQAQPAAQVLDADPEVVPGAAGPAGEGGEPGRRHEVQGRGGRRGQHPVHGDIVQRQHRHPDGLGSQLPAAW